MLSLGIALSIVFALTGYLVINTVFNQSREDARLYMESLSREYANRLDAILEIPMNYSSALATAMASVDEVPAASRRSYILDILSRTMEKDELYFAVWAMWEPNAIDGADSDFRGDEAMGSDADGVFGPYYFREGSAVEMEASSWEEEHEEDFYAVPRDTLSDYMTEPYPYEVRGKTVMMVSTVAPIIRDGKFLGVAGIDIAIDDIDSKLGRVSLYRTGFGRLVSNKGIVVSHPDPERIGQPAPEWSGPESEAFIEKLEAGDAFTQIAFSESLQRNTLKSFVPIFIGESKYPWVYGTVVPQEETYEHVWRILNLSVIIFVSGLIVILLILWLLATNFLKPLKATRDALKEIAEGDGDLTRSLEAKTSDETGALARNFNDFTGKLRQILLEVRSELDSLSGIGKNLNADLQETTTAISQINGNIEGVGASFAEQVHAVEEVSSTIEEIVGNIASLDRLIEEQGRSLDSGASAVEQMVANVQSITRNIDDGNLAFTKLRTSSDEGYGKLSSVAETVGKISVQSSGLEETNAIITSIASQTNLLAMNAAIEAAHAGEAGKGFAVVADEIRKLAEDTAERSREISQTLDNLESAIQQAVVLSSEAGLTFESIRKAVDEVSARQEEIRLAVTEQTEGNKVVLENMDRLKRIGTEVTSGSAEMSAGSEAILKTIHRLSSLTSEMRRMITEISSGTAEINSSASHVSALSGNTERGIEAVKAAVGRFRV